MTEEYKAKLQALLRAYAERAANAQPTTPQDQADRRMCGERLRAVVRPVLDAIMAELKNAGHDASVREHFEPQAVARAEPDRHHRRIRRLGRNQDSELYRGGSQSELVREYLPSWPGGFIILPRPYSVHGGLLWSRSAR